MRGRGRAALAQEDPVGGQAGGNDPCPCHSGAKHRSCCGPFHEGAPAPTPEALMRSRYSAYALGKTGYLMDTTDPDGPHAQEDRGVWARELAEFARRTRFVGLEINGSGSTGDDGWVSFRAILTQGRRDASFAERSRFVRRDGRWLYVSGD